GLKKMRVRIKAAGQIGEVTIHGWDPKEKREIVGKAKAEGETGEGSKEQGGSATLAVAGDDHIPADVATGEAMAKGRMRKLAEGFVTAQVEMIGNAGVQPGALLTFDKMGEKLDGKYRVEKARHDFGKHGYVVSFQAVRISKKSNADAQKQKAAKQAGQEQAKKQKEPVEKAQLTGKGDLIEPVHIEAQAEITPPPHLETEAELASE